jgi:hypothetical protein
VNESPETRGREMDKQLRKHGKGPEEAENLSTWLV